MVFLHVNCRIADETLSRIWSLNGNVSQRETLVFRSWDNQKGSKYMKTCGQYTGS